MHDPAGDFFLQYGTIVENTDGGFRYDDAAGHCGAAGHDDPAGHYDWYGSGAAFDALRSTFTVPEGTADWQPGGTYVFPRSSLLQKNPTPMGAEARSRSPRARRRRDPVAASWPRTVGLAFGTLSTLAFTTVCLLGWMFSYDPLQDLALSRAPGTMARLWPIVVLGPWFVGCLSVLRAAVDGRRVVHSWFVVILFSTVCAGLCIADASRTVLDMVVVGLPPLTAAVCLHQLVRQLSCRKPPGQPASLRGSHRLPR
ncbi:DUF2637 domain-containing protein [Kitasatospora sp. NPDC051914]|uniref:DUF2637 domain-containing protein n=1 Tax=Kitasatospora sp. NPDC051914 TaxID=3154945 RepID=UPI0034426989